MKITMRAVSRIVPCLLLSLSGCAGLGRGAPAPHHYVLGAGGHDERAAPVEPSAAGVPVIGLRPPRLADYLANPFIVVRHGTHRIGFSEFDRWGEDLARGINRTLATYMAASPGHRVESAPWPPGARPEYLVQLHVLRFEGVAPEDPLAVTGEAHLLATWEILRAGDAAVLTRGTTEVRSNGWTIGDFDELVGLLDAALGTLADDLVVGLERVENSAGASDAPEGRPILRREDVQ